MAKSLYGVVVGHPFRNTVKIIMFLKSRLRFGDENREGLRGQEGDSGSHQLIEGTEGLFLLCHVAGSLSEGTREIPLCPDGYAALKEHRN